MSTCPPGRGYVRKIGRHIRPLLGSTAVGKLDTEILESFYAVLRRCREHCNGRRYVEHRKPGSTHAHRSAGRTSAEGPQTRLCGRSTGSSAGRWSDIDLSAGVLVLRRALYLDELGELREKGTKTHQ